MPGDLPEFERPPLVEVVLGVQFEPLERLRVVHLGLLWQDFRDRFPRTEEQVPLEPAVELFGATRPTQPLVRFTVRERPPVPRVWLLSHSGTELIQIQQDRFIRNWRKSPEDARYPRYHKLKEAFQKDYAVFCHRIEQEGLGDIRPNQCEVTYVNVIPANKLVSGHAGIHRICTLFTISYSDGQPPPLEEGALRATYLLRNDKDEPCGRIRVSLEPVLRRHDHQPAFRLLLTARGSPYTQDIGGILSFFDRAHGEIVRTFTAITTPEMHREWGRVR